MSKRFSAVALFVALAFVALGISGAAQAQTYEFSTLYSFRNNGTDPYSPSSLIIDSKGNLYGTSLFGGTHGQGTVFEITSKGVLTVLHNFDGSDGSWANTLALDTRQGNLYGTTYDPVVLGTVFKMVRESGGTYSLSTLYSDARAQPTSVTLDSMGNLYGVDNDCSCLFEVPADGQWTDIYDIGSDPFAAEGNLLVPRPGQVYASMNYEGISGFGWVQAIGPNSRTYDLPTGYGPDSLTHDAAGNIYGLAFGGFQGARTFGLVFKIDPTSGPLTPIYTFAGKADGQYPRGTFAIDSAGNVYGTAEGGKTRYGLVFKVTPSGTEDVIFNFPYPVGAGLVMDASGNLYGISAGSNAGAIYKLTLVK